jgi:hypothetical protein
MKLTLAFTAAVVLAAIGLSAQTSSKILAIDHKVTVKSTVPAIAGQPAQIYVRERVAEGMKNPAPDRVVLFVHGAGTPAEVAFDVPTGRLQLDGASREGRLRRLLDGHHRLRPIGAAGADGRSRVICRRSNRSSSCRS